MATDLQIDQDQATYDIESQGVNHEYSMSEIEAQARGRNE